MNQKVLTKSDAAYIRDILAKSLDLRSLNLKEVSALLAVEEGELWSEIFDSAGTVVRDI
jgi:hypothetical protein